MLSVDEQPESSPISKKPRQSFPFQNFQVSAGSGGLCLDTEVVECLEVALLSWNVTSLAEQGPEYVLVEVTGCKRMVGPTIYHCNFIARPKNGSGAENKLFFAELKYSKDFIKDGEAGTLCCSVCCIIEPSEMGSVGCGICELHPTRIHHPENEEFIKGRKDAFKKFTAKKQSESRKRLEKQRDSSCAPRVQLCLNCNAPPSERFVRKNVDFCLSSWNERSLLEQGPEFALVEILGFSRMIMPSIYHCNFIAKPKNGSEAERKLFFAEVMFDLELDCMRCTVCCIIGPSGTKTGLLGCEFCKLRPGLIQHPRNGEFTKGRDDARLKVIKKGLSLLNW